MFRPKYSRLMSALICLFSALQTLAAQTQVDLHSQSRGVDFQAAPYTRPLKSSATLPATCTQNELLYLTTATAGSNIYACVSPGVWVPEAGTSAQSPVIENNGTPVASRPIQNYVSGLGLTNILTDLGTQINIQQGIDTTAVVSQASEQSGQTLMCASASGSGTAYTCNLSPPLTGYTAGMLLHWIPDLTAAGGGTTLNVETLGAVSVTGADGSTSPTPSQIVAGQLYLIWYDGTVFRLISTGSGGSGGSGGGSIPSGAPNKVYATDPSGSITDAAALRVLVSSDLPAALRTRGFQVALAGSDLTPGATVYVTMPYACTASGYVISADPAGSATIRLWKIADGTSLPTSANSISTNGFSLSSGNRIHSASLTDLSTTAWAAWDSTGVSLSAVSGNPNHVNFTLECDQ